MLKYKRSVPAALAGLLVVVVAIVMYSRRSREDTNVAVAPPATAVVPPVTKGSLSHQGASFPAVPEVHAPPKREKHGFTEEEAYAFKAFIPPLWDESTLEDCGFDIAHKDKLDAHLEDTYLLLMEYISAYGEEAQRTLNHTKLTVLFPEQVSDQLRAFFYDGLEQIVGKEGMERYYKGGSVPYVETELLGFGELPMIVALDLNVAAGPPRLTISTYYLRKGELTTESRGITYLFPNNTMRSILPNLSKKLFSN